LLNHLTHDKEYLAGDLIEQFRAGRTRLWYWRQVLLAIAVHAAADIRTYKLLTVRAAIVCTAVLLAWVNSTHALYLWVSHQWVNAWANESRAWTVNWHYFGGHLHLVWCVGAALSGGLTVRLHRHHLAATIFTGVVCQLPWVVWWGLPIWMQTLNQPHFPWTVAHRVVAVFILIGMPVCTLLGGLWAASVDDVSDDGVSADHRSRVSESTR
jgi:hypothetical protein